jgi:hypothetical protein
MCRARGTFQNADADLEPGDLTVGVPRGRVLTRRHGTQKLTRIGMDLPLRIGHARPAQRPDGGHPRRGVRGDRPVTRHLGH